MWWGADAKFMYKGIVGAPRRRARARVRGMRDRFAVNKSNYQGRFPRQPHPGRSQFPVPVQSFRSPRRTGQGSQEGGLVAKEGVMREQGFRAKERYVPRFVPVSTQTRAARPVFPFLSSWQLEEQEAICRATRSALLRVGRRDENDENRGQLRAESSRGPARNRRGGTSRERTENPWSPPPAELFSTR